MDRSQIMERGLNVVFFGAALFLLFVTVLVWRAAVQIRAMRHRLEELRRTLQRQQTRDLEAVSGVDDWVPRR